MPRKSILDIISGQNQVKVTKVELFKLSKLVVFMHNTGRKSFYEKNIKRSNSHNAISATVLQPKMWGFGQAEGLILI